MNLVDLNGRVDEPAVRKVLEHSHGSPEAFEQACAHYRTGEWTFIGWQEGEEVLACAGAEPLGSDTIGIRSIAVDPEWRHHGLGRTLLAGLAERSGAERIVAETDDDAVGFYRRCGFVIEDAPPKFGQARYWCVRDDARTVSTVDVAKTSWLDPRIVTKSSGIHGTGLFAADRFESGELVMRLGGEILTDREVRDVIHRGERYDGIALEEDRNLSIRPTDWPGIYGNHSCEPNVWLTGAAELRALKEIHPGEEVTSDYATYTMTSGWSMSCACGTPDCRGLVTGDDWKEPILQERYRGHFALPITRRIEASRRPE